MPIKDTMHKEMIGSVEIPQEPKPTPYYKTIICQLIKTIGSVVIPTAPEAPCQFNPLPIKTLSAYS